MPRLEALFDWLVDAAPGATTSDEVVDRLGKGLIEAGLPIERFALFVTTLHPTVLGLGFYWSPHAPLRVGELTDAMRRSPVFQASPVAHTLRTGEGLRARLAGDEPLPDYEVVRELAREGFTDYVCLPLTFSSGEIHAATFATKRPEGFGDAELERLRDLLRPLARVTEIFALRRTAQNLLDTYVGHHTGARILSGRITKGDLETLRAVLWFSDLRGFTELSQRLSPALVLATLNELFDCQVPAIEAQGGEVLKFMGDGLLAIFPFDDDASIGAACRRALFAAQLARAQVASRNERATTPIHFGVALHVGEVAYGNVGGASRLDFTCIGSAVNLAARLEGLTGKLGRVLVISEALAAHIDEPLDELGTFELKGVHEPVRVFSPSSTPEGPHSLR